jgi:D-3-phosphoglycerate dehydrogenase
MPAVSVEDIETLGPFAPLAKRLGALAMELAGGRAERIVLSYRGRLAEHDTRALSVAALNGVFEGRTEQPVNAVNAALVAAERGIMVEEQSERVSPDYTSLVEVSLSDEEQEAAVSGTILGGESRHWLVGALGFKIEIELAPLMVFFQYDDRPGVIGRVGTLFGQAGINIANMAVSRTNEGGGALMALSIDSPAPVELVTEFRAAGFDDARFIRLG